MNTAILVLLAIKGGADLAVTIHKIIEISRTVKSMKNQKAES